MAIHFDMLYNKYIYYIPRLIPMEKNNTFYIIVLLIFIFYYDIIPT